MDLQKRYNTIDVMKMIMAFNVVGIHTGTYFDTNFPIEVNYVLDMAVPFFFICSGFFIQNKISRSENLFFVLNRSCIRYVKLYVIWQILFFPVALKFLITNSHDFWENLSYCIHNFLFVGEIVFSWPLWYLHGLIISVIIVYLLYKIKLSLIQIWIVSVIMMLFGYYITEICVSDVNLLSLKIASIFGSTDRNGPYRGFALVTTGMIIHKYLMNVRYKFFLGIFCILISYHFYRNSLPLHLILSGGGLFMVVSSFTLVDHSYYVSLRFCSTMIYFIHMFFVILAHTLLKKYVDGVTRVYLIWIAIFIVAWIGAFIMYNLRKCRYFQWINHLV